MLIHTHIYFIRKVIYLYMHISMGVIIVIHVFICTCVLIYVGILRNWDLDHLSKRIHNILMNKIKNLPPPLRQGDVYESSVLGILVGESL